MSNWTDELKAQAVELYEAVEPTPENTMEIVGEIADELGFSPNGVRMILSKEGVYVAKTPAKAASKAGSTGGGKRTSKAEAIEALKAAITEAGKEVDDSIVDKLTGKAAAYFTSLL